MPLRISCDGCPNRRFTNGDDGRVQCGSPEVLLVILVVSAIITIAAVILAVRDTACAEPKCQVCGKPTNELGDVSAHEQFERSKQGEMEIPEGGPGL